jgi:broad specificity phosphatase PhoE
MLRFSLIRHAMTSWNMEKKIQGRKDLALSPEGVEQAELWGEILKTQSYDLIIASPMIRAKQTARIISGITATDIEYEDDLREQNFGNWEGRKLKEIQVESPGQVELQESRGWEFCPPDGESRLAVLKRVAGVMERIAEKFDGQNILIVSHSSVMKIIVYKALKRTFTRDEPLILKNYHLHSMVWDSRVKVEKLNYLNLQVDG